MMSKSSSGFSLIELMVTVAIIGILSSIAIPNFQQFVAKARQTEAKSNLAAIYTTEKNYQAEAQTFSDCLWQEGYQPDANAARYYSTGFYNGGSPAPGTNSYEGTPCSYTGFAWGTTFRDDVTFLANRAANPSLLMSGLTGDYDCYTNTTFTAAAWGSISGSAVLDVWTIDQDNNLTNTQPGF